MVCKSIRLFLSGVALLAGTTAAQAQKTYVHCGRLLDVRSGKVHGKTAARHTSDEFVDFLDEVWAVQTQAGNPRHPRQPLGP